MVARLLGIVPVIVDEDIPQQPTASSRTADSDAAIRVTDVSKTFGDAASGVRALEHVTFDVRHGEFVSVLGPSGCGKSTLLRIVAALTAPDPPGRVDLLGRKQTEPSRDVGVVFQTHNMLPWLTVEDNIRLLAEVRGIPDGEIAARLEPMLRILRLEGFRRNYPHELSGGMRQRAALGQTLLLKPQVLLLDEPFGALDALTRDQLNVELLRLCQEINKTVILITHSIAEAVFLSDRVLVMSDRPGHIIEDLKVVLPRPREPHATKAMPEFSKYVLHLNRLMGVD
jgi:NitT/TauT family transport system ATP-binding protein